jgi:DnaK suppressor protein
MTLDLDFFRQKLLDRQAMLRQEDERSAADRLPVELDQTSVGRLSRMDALQVQAMALAQQRRRQNEQAAVDAALAAH